VLFAVTRNLHDRAFFDRRDTADAVYVVMLLKSKIEGITVRVQL
jgi:hypothetical protein